MTRTAALAALVFVPMLIEARRASANERRQRARGAIEPPDDGPVYRLMQMAYPGAFAAMIAESAVRGGASNGWLLAGAACFVASKAVKWWAILTLGPFWTFRVMVVPGHALVERGPYRFLRHPNYAGVAGELAGAAMMTAASVSGALSAVLFGMLLKRRIAVEQRALDSAARHPPCSL